MKIKKATLCGERKYRWSILPVLAYLNYTDEDYYVYRHVVIIGWIQWHIGIMWGKL
jgi:hypothetical protein